MVMAIAMEEKPLTANGCDMIAAMPGLASRLDETLGRAVDGLASPRIFPVVVVGYAAMIFVLRGFMFPAASGDEAEQLLFSQQFAWGYQVRNPPLYTWLVIGATQVLGVVIHAVTLVKVTFLTLTYLFLYYAGRRLFRDPALAALAALAPLAIYYVAWDAVLGYSHSIALMAACAATFWALLRLADRGSLADYLVLGACLGVGFLVKYNYAVFVGALGLAAWADRDLRRRLTDRRMLAAMALAAAMALPHYLWLSRHAGAAIAQVTGEGVIREMPTGISEIARAYVNFHLSLMLLVAVLFWPSLTRKGSPAGPMASRQRLLANFLLAAFVIFLAYALLSGTARFRTHYLFILIPLPLYLFCRIEAAGYTQASLRRFAGALLLLTAIVTGGLVVKYVGDPLWCRKCTLHVPYADLARELRAKGFEGGKIISWFHPYLISGNLRPYFPGSAIASLKYPIFNPPGLKAPGPCLAIWDAGRKHGEQGYVLEQAETRLGATITGAETVHTIHLPFAGLGMGNKQVGFSYVLIPKGQGTCR